MALEPVEPLEPVIVPVDSVPVAVDPSVVDEPSVVGPDGPPTVVGVVGPPVTSLSLVSLPLEQAPTSATPISQSPTHPTRTHTRFCTASEGSSRGAKRRRGTSPPERQRALAASTPNSTGAYCRVYSVYCLPTSERCISTETGPDQSSSSGTFARSSASQVVASESLGARQSPRGDSEPPEPTLGPLGTQLRLNCEI